MSQVIGNLPVRLGHVESRACRHRCVTSANDADDMSCATCMANVQRCCSDDGIMLPYSAYLEPTGSF